MVRVSAESCPFFEVLMFLRRVFGRTLFAAAKSEASAAGAAASMVRHNPLEEFFEADRNQDDEKPLVYGKISLFSFLHTYGYFSSSWSSFYVALTPHY